MSQTNVIPLTETPVVPLIIRGKLIEDNLLKHEGRGGGSSFLTPDVSMYLDQLPLRNHGDLKDLQQLTTDEIIDFLVEFGKTLDVETNEYIRHARELSYATAPTTPPIVEDEFKALKYFFNRPMLEEMIAEERAYFEGWVEKTSPNGRVKSIRAFGTRGLHITAGNSPYIAAMTIVRSALTRGDAIIKNPSNDPFTAAAILSSMIEFAPDHPVTKHFSVTYWKGGDEAFERRFFLPANIEKILAWGGFASVKHVTKYIQPGLELISLDPKRSMSIVGPETFESEDSMRAAAVRVAADIGTFNQVGCANSRKVFMFAGTDIDGIEKANQFGQMAYDAMMGLPERLSTKPKFIEPELKSNVEALRFQDDFYKVIGGDHDEGAIIVSQLPGAVEFDTSLDNRIANFIPVDSIDEVTKDIDAYTQTVGIYPESFKREVQDILPLYGAQRIVSLGWAVLAESAAGPQDGIEPLRRMIKWLTNENCAAVEFEPWATVESPY